MKSKVVAAELEREIYRRVDEFPIPLDLSSRVDNEWVSHRIEAAIRRYHLQRNASDGASLTIAKRGAMRAMIYDRAWSEQLAEFYNLEREDVIEYNSTLVHWESFVNRELHENFRAYMRLEAERAYAEELEKLNRHQAEVEKIAGKAGGLLRKLLIPAEIKRLEYDNLPRLVIEKRLRGANYDLYGKTHHEQIVEELEALEFDKNRKKLVEMDDGEIREYSAKIMKLADYRSKKAELEKARKATQEYANYLYSRRYVDKDSNKNFLYIDTIGLNELENPKAKANYFHVGSVTHGLKLISEYMRWFNHEFSQEIREYEQHEYERKLEVRIAKRALDKLLRNEYRDRSILSAAAEGLSKAEINRQLTFPVRTIGDVIKRFKNTSIDQELDQARIRLSELDQPLFTLQDLENEDLCKSLQREAKEQERKRFDQFLISEHAKGKTASLISKNVKDSARKVQEKLKKLSLGPHFDFKLATDEEKRARCIQQAEEIKQRIKNNPLNL